MKDAIVAVEDRRYYAHPGGPDRDYTVIYVLAVNGRWTQGGSTLTQQLAAKYLPEQQQGFGRKIRRSSLRRHGNQIL